MNDQKTGLVQRGACWKHLDRNKKPYLSGQIKEDDGTVREILVFQNTKKDNPKAPDYRILEKVAIKDDNEFTDPADPGDSGDIPF